MKWVLHDQGATPGGDGYFSDRPLMKEAGEAAFELVLEPFSESCKSRLIIWCSFFSNDALFFCYFIGAPSYPKWKSVLSSGMVKTLKYLWQKEYIYIYIERERERERDFNSVLYLLPWVQNYSSISKDHDYHKRIKVWIQEIF